GATGTMTRGSRRRVGLSGAASTSGGGGAGARTSGATTAAGPGAVALVDGMPGGGDVAVVGARTEPCEVAAGVGAAGSRGMGGVVSSGAGKSPATRSGCGAPPLGDQNIAIAKVVSPAKSRPQIPSAASNKAREERGLG